MNIQQKRHGCSVPFLLCPQSSDKCKKEGRSGGVLTAFALHFCGIRQKK